MLDTNYTQMLESLSGQVRRTLIETARLRRFKRGSMISFQGRQTPDLKVVQSGWVKLYREGQRGEQAVMAMLREGRSFDEVALVRGQGSLMSAEAVTDCSILYFDLSAVLDCKKSCLEISNALMESVFGQFEALLDDVEMLKVNTAAERLSEYLVDLAEIHGDGGNLMLPFRKNVLASRLGMKPESLSRAFSRLKPLGVTCKGRQIRIRDLAALRSACADATGRD